MLRCLALLVLLSLAGPAGATEAGWALLREGGHVVLLRHAAAAGTSESASVDIENCGTQRGLSERGRQQARRIGALFAARAEPVETVLTSRYCRCLDTARLAFGDRLTEPFEALDQLPKEEAAAKAAHDAVVGAIGAYSGSGNMVLVTHLENIVDLTGQNAREGEAVIVRSDGNALHVLGRIVFN